MHFYAFRQNTVFHVFEVIFLTCDRRIRYEALQSEAGKNLLRRSGRAPDDISSVVLVEKER